MKVLERFANKVARRAENNEVLKSIEVLVIVSIIQTLIPYIIECFQPDDEEQAQQYIANRYNAADSDNKYGGFERSLVRAAARQAKRAAREQGSNLSFKEAQALAILALNEVLEQEPEELKLLISENY